MTMDLKTEYNYIIFKKFAQKEKTSVWYCLNKSGDYRLGRIQWNPGWRQYCFFPEPQELVFSAGCLNDICEFMDNLRNWEKQEVLKMLGKESAR